MSAGLPPGRTFSVKGKRGYLIDGEPVDLSVTDILERGVPKPALVKWAADEAAACVVNEWDALAGMSPFKRGAYVSGARFRTSDPAKLRGTELHQLLEGVILGREVEVPDRLYEAAKALTTLVDTWRLEPVLTEAPVVNFTYGYAGRLDLVVNDITGQRAILDLKSGKAVYDDAALQLSAYRFAEGYLDGDGALCPMVEVDAARVIHVTVDSAELVPVDAGERTWRTLLHAAMTARWRAEGYRAWKENRPWPVGRPLTAPTEAAS